MQRHIFNFWTREGPQGSPSAMMVFLLHFVSSSSLGFDEIPKGLLIRNQS